jgi:hypothetical protein
MLWRKFSQIQVACDALLGMQSAQQNQELKCCCMKQIVMMALGALWASGTLAGGADFYVSAAGNDSNPGTLASPFASMARARDAIRGLKQAGQSAQMVTVHFAGGIYRLDRPIEFTTQDSGSPAAPTVYQAQPGALVRITGGREVTRWQRVTDPAILNRLPTEARSQVVVADLRAIGITNYGKLAVRGFGEKTALSEAELFYDDAPMTLARWPNSGFQKVKSSQRS